MPPIEITEQTNSDTDSPQLTQCHKTSASLVVQSQSAAATPLSSVPSLRSFSAASRLN